MPEENTIRYWKISPGERAFLWDECRKNNLICLGWSHDTNWKKTKFGDLVSKSNKELIKNVLREEYLYEHTEKQISSWADIIKDFFDIKPSHKVIVYDKDYHINALADVIGEYEFNKKIEYPHTKAVEWIKIFDPPYNIKPFEDELVKKISRNRTVVEITKNDWDTIYAKGVGGKTVPSHRPFKKSQMITDDVSPFEAEAKLLPEGAKTTISVNKYERNPQARKKCIENYGTKCQICGFCFKEKYGSIGEDFIEVHHKKPISEIGESYVVNPVDDLSPVCSNCHSMLHRKRGQTIDVEELKEFIRQEYV